MMSYTGYRVCQNRFCDCSGHCIKQKVTFGTPTPHKCPSCYGEGARQYNHPFDPQTKTETCKSCDGKGIVWG
jgi:DnaJ-class molecular chaperone